MARSQFPEIELSMLENSTKSKRAIPVPVVDLGEQALLPGLINAHCHLDYTCLRGKIPRQKSFTDWIRAINAEKSKLSPVDFIASINEGFAETKRFGTTTIANLTAFPELVRRFRCAASHVVVRGINRCALARARQMNLSILQLNH